MNILSNRSRIHIRSDRPFSGGSRRVIWGIAIVALVLVSAVAVMFWPKGSSPPASALLEARTLVAFAQPEPSDPLRSQLVISTGADERKIGGVDSYSALSFSPDGRTLAALASATAPGEGSRLHLIAVDGSGETIQAIAEEASSVFPIWAPDGANVAVVGAQTVLFTANGKQVGDVAAPTLPNAVGAEHSSGGFGWSSDSQQFGVITDDTLLLISARGESIAQDLALLGIDDKSPAVFLGWKGPGVAYVGATGGESSSVWAFDISTGALSVAVASPEEQLPVPAGLLLASNDSVSEVAALVSNGVVVRAKPSADGNADIVEVLDGNKAAGLHVFIRDRITGTPFEVQNVPDETRGGALLDAYVETPN